MSERLISHAVLPDALDATIRKISARIVQQGDKPHVTRERQLELLHQLAQFDFGRFILQHQGINGFWTHYMLTHPWFGKKSGLNNRGDILGDLEKFILERSPIMLATQQRFAIFLRENQKQVENGAKLACIPCGMMGELLYLNFTDTNAIELVGIDYDPDTLVDAQSLTKKQGLENFMTLKKKDAWQLNIENEFDLISSNGLSIYEPNDDKIIDLFQEFYRALKPGGKLVTSFLTYPPTLTDQCEWDFSKVNPDDLLLQRIIFIDIIEPKFQCYRSTAQTRKQLENVGFRDIQFIYDEAKIFPTVVAYK